MIKAIYSTGDRSGENPVFTSWLSSNRYQNNLISQRVNCDMYGDTTAFSLRNPGINEKVEANIVGRHKAVCDGNGLLQKYKNSNFTEYIVQIDRNHYISTESGESSGLLVFGEMRFTKKREIIYVLKS